MNNLIFPTMISSQKRCYFGTISTAFKRQNAIACENERQNFIAIKVFVPERKMQKNVSIIPQSPPYAQSHQSQKHQSSCENALLQIIFHLIMAEEILLQYRVSHVGFKHIYMPTLRCKVEFLGWGQGHMKIQLCHVIIAYKSMHLDETNNGASFVSILNM